MSDNLSSQRQLRFSELIRSLISECLLVEDFYNLSFETTSITISFVKMSKDLRIANVYLMPLGGVNKKNTIEDKVLADSCEALIGSIYLDKGFQAVEKVILNLWSNNIEDSVVTQVDAKTKLQEFSLKKFKKLPIYKLISNTGPRHKPLFKVGVKLLNTKLYVSEGKSKKDAEQNAAILCLQNIKKI